MIKYKTLLQIYQKWFNGDIVPTVILYTENLPTDHRADDLSQ